MVSYAITGASRGLGLEFIRQLSQNPANLVFAIVRNTNSSPELTTLGVKYPNVYIVKGDITSLAELQEAAKTVSSITGGGLDVLVNNGAFLDDAVNILPPSQLTNPEHLEVVKDAITKSVEANVLGAIYVTNAFLPLIEQGTEKKIVLTSTGMADTDLVLGTEIAAAVPYSASKAMLNNVIAKYGAELKPKGIHIAGISPGWVNTKPEPQEALDWMASMFRKIDPNVKGRIEPEESVRLQMETIAKLGWEAQGMVVSHHGDRNWF